MRAKSRYLERKGDLDNLNTAMKTYKFEQDAMKLKDKEEKQTLKDTWETQMR